ncbi:MAG: sulfite exporter TauE/SafE family protein [Candidatus Omnitrophota bacterium]
MAIIELLKIGAVLILGSIVQSSSGFGFSLVSLPFLLFMGLGLPEAVMTIMVASAFQKITAVSYLWKSIDWKGHASFMAIGFLSIPLGVYSMYRISFFSKSSIEQMIGVVIFLLLLLQWWDIIKIQETVSRFWGYTAGFFSGFLDGLANIGGPPLVLWILAHRWSNEKMRATPLAFAIVFTPMQFVFMAIAFGSRMWSPFVKASLLTPLVLVGSWIGLKIGEKFSKKHLLLYMRLLLLSVVLSAIVKPFVR